MKAFVIDAFTDRPFRGNPAAACLVKFPLSDDQMLSIAQEFNLSETAFIARLGPRGAFSIRYFSPKKEIPLCGHATLAAARAVHAVDGLDEVHRFRKGKNRPATREDLQALAMGARSLEASVSRPAPGPLPETMPRLWEGSDRGRSRQPFSG